MHWAKTVKFWAPKSNHAFIEIIKINAVTFLTASHPDLNYFPGTSVAHNPCSFLVFTRSTLNISQQALKLIAGRFLKTQPCLLYIHFFPFFAISKPAEHTHMRVGSITLQQICLLPKSTSVKLLLKKKNIGSIRFCLLCSISSYWILEFVLLWSTNIAFRRV